MLPDKLFFERMKLIYDAPDEVAGWYSSTHGRGLRINPLKLPSERAGELGFSLEPVPFSPLGFRLTDENERPGRSAWHHAGAFYMQEPSAMSAVTALDPQPGERILDMCAAPGGKSTQIAALLKQSGLLFANEFVRSRANILVSNIERMGIRNAVVTSLHPDTIAERLTGFFHRVLVDAPCSGEGMFRREEAAVTEWSAEHVRTCAVRQRGILDSAAKCVVEGGVLVYSTCTFAPEENEMTVAAFLYDHPDFHLEPIPAQFGRNAMDGQQLAAFASAHPSDVCCTHVPESITYARRIFPSDGGEGHFVARMRRDGAAKPDAEECNLPAAVSDSAPLNELLESCFTEPLRGYILTQGDSIYLLPCTAELLSGLPVIRAGVLLGTIEKKRIEPHHALFMATAPSVCRSRLELDADSPLLDRFLHGEQLEVSDELRGYTVVTCSGVSVGFGKASGGALKNRYPKGLRLL